MHKMMKLTMLATGVLVVAASQTAFAQQPLQKYTPWKFDAQKQRYTCEYHFKPTPQTPVYKKQAVVYYPKDKDRQGYFFYYNMEKKTYWGRCANKQHPQYQGNQMQWSYRRNNLWSTLSNTCPTIPGSTGGPEIILPPDPPAI